MQNIKGVVLQIIDILEYFVSNDHPVVIPHKYFNDRSESLQTLGLKLSKLNQSVADYLFVGVIAKAPAEALRHVRLVLEEIILAEAGH